MRKLILTSAAVVGTMLAVSSRLLFGRLGMDLISGLCFVLFALFAVYSSRRRAGWANTAFVAVGVLGFAKCMASWLIDSGFALASARATHTISVIQVALGGFVLGLIAALVLSGEFLGAQSKGTKGEHIAAPNGGPAPLHSSGATEESPQVS